MLKEQVQKWSEQLGIEWMLDSLIEEEKAAGILLLLIHKGFNNSIWGSKRLRYWDAFKGKLDLHLGEESLPILISKFAEDMQASIGRNSYQREIATEIAWCKEADAILETIREESLMLVTLARVMQQAIKAQYDYEEKEKGENEHD